MAQSSTNTTEEQTSLKDFVVPGIDPQLFPYMNLTTLANQSDGSDLYILYRNYPSFCIRIYLHKLD